MKIKNLKVIGFDADDTLWINEPYFREAEESFCDLMESFMPRHDINRALFSREISNLPLYGYGIKAFMLSMIEAAIHISGRNLPIDVVSKIIDIGRRQLDQPVEVIENVEYVLQSLQKTYRLVIVTKGDLLDQEKKLEKSGLAPYFHHIEIVSEKGPANYQKLIKHLDIQASHFMMVGNSLKSDIMPVLEIGGYGIHVPFHTTWEHEHVDIKITDPKFRQIEQISEILNMM
ncbi:MAG: HAD family hydrolase [Saprospiraceae bacterium]|nr:HAD family hydrolase [Saprospiraceae bacterium]